MIHFIFVFCVQTIFSAVMVKKKLINQILFFKTPQRNAGNPPRDVFITWTQFGEGVFLIHFLFPFAGYFALGIGRKLCSWSSRKQQGNSLHRPCRRHSHFSEQPTRLKIQISIKIASPMTWTSILSSGKSRTEQISKIKWISWPKSLLKSRWTWNG
jgi:hypothetical protein